MDRGKETPREPERTSASSVSGVEVPSGSPVEQGAPYGEAAEGTPVTSADEIERTSKPAENAAESEPAPASETKSLESSDSEQNKPSASEKNKLQKCADNLKALFTALSSTFLFVLLLAFIVSLGMELARSTVFLDLLEVPKDLRDDGLTATAVSQELADQLAEIQRISLSKNTQRLLEPAWTQPDIQVPGSSISFHSISQWLKQRLGNPIVKKDIHLTGELTKDGNNYRLTVRRADENVNNNHSITLLNNTISQVVTLGAEAVANLADPVTLASYYFYVEDRNDHYLRTIRTIKQVIGSGDDQTKARAYNLWGNVLADQDDAKHATSMYEEAIRYDKNLGEAYVNWGNTLLFDLNDPTNAITKFNAAIDTNPKLSSSYNGLGLALDTIDKPNEALDKFQSAIETADPDDYWPYVNKANLLSSVGRQEEALAAYKKARELIEEKIYRDETRPGTKTGTLVHYSDPYNALCQILTSTGDFSNAIRSGEAAVTIDGTDPEAHRCLGVALQEVGRLEESTLHLRQTLALRSMSYWAQNDLGNTLMRRGSFDEAEEVYRSLVKLYPMYHQGWYNLGRARFEKGDHAKAVEYVEKAAKLYPRAGAITASLADFLLRDGKYRSSVEAARSAIRVNDDDFGYHYQLAVGLYRLGKITEAEFEASRAASLAARLEAAHRRMNYDYGLAPDEYSTWGWALHDLGHMEEAQEKFEHALKIDPANVQASVGLADILDTSGNIDAEVVTLQAVNQINPNDYSVHVALGNAFMAHKQTDKAAEEFKRAFEINERLPDALLGDAQRLSLEGNKPAALEKAKQAAEIVPDSKDASLAVDKYKAALGLN